MLWESGVQQGSDTTPDWQSSTGYMAETVNGITCYYTSSSTQYQSAGEGDPEVTSYQYTFYSAADVSGPAIETEATTPPLVDTAHGGTVPVGGTTGPTSTDVYNGLGQVVWSQDANGSISYTGYDAATGAVDEQIQDVNNSNAGLDTTCLPAGWTLPTAGKNLITRYDVDSQGRTIWEQDPDGDITCTVYIDAARIVTDDGNSAVILNEVRTYPGLYQDSAGDWETTGAVQVSNEVATSDGLYTQSLTYSWDGLTVTTDNNGHAVPTGSEHLPDAAIDSLSRSITNDQGQVYEEDDYTNVPDGDYTATQLQLTGSGVGYNITTNQYDAVGNLTETTDPDGNMTHTVYDFLGRVTSTWVGKSDGCGSDDPGYGGDDTWSPANNPYPSNMVETSANVYDYGGVGDGNLTSSTDYIGGSSANRVTAYGYDWQDQQTYVVDPPDAAGVTYTMTTYDNLGEATWTRQYTFGGEVSGIPTTLAAATAEPPALLAPGLDTLRSQSESLYDTEGDVYQTNTWRSIRRPGRSAPSRRPIAGTMPTETRPRRRTRTAT